MGTTYKSILFSCLAVTLSCNIAFADNPCASPKDVNAISLAGINYSGASICVLATKDGKAADACKGVGGGAFQFAVNPGNKNYKGYDGDGGLDWNKAGYYLCVNKKPAMEDFNRANPEVAAFLQSKTWFTSGIAELNNKRTMCESIAAEASPWLKQGAGYEQLKITWIPVGNDGNCMCGYEGGPREMCGAEPPHPPQAIVDASIRSNNPVTPETTSDAVAAVTASGVDQRLNTCIQSHLAKAHECETEAEAAKNSCDEKNSNNVGNRTSSPTRMASGATQLMGQMYNMQNQAAGAQAECFRAGAIANTASTAIGEMETVCKSNLTNCSRLCNGNGNETKLAEFKRLCAEAIGKTSADLEADQTSPNGVAFNNAANEIQQTIEPALRVCTVDAQKNKNTLGKLMDGVGRALQASVQCACQTSSTGTNCQNIPPVQDCASIPQPAGCGGYEAMGTCSIGSPSYNAKTCGCMQNPAAPGCNGGSNAVSAFSGPPIASNLAQGTPGGGVNFGGGGGGRASGLTLGGGNTDVDNDLGFLNGSKPSGSGAANGSVGGGGAAVAGGAANGAAGEPAVVGGEEEKGIGGIFSAAKSFMANTLGIGKKSPSKNTENGALGKPDMGKFKPLRGLAGRSGGMGSRNMDIWKMMNACSSGDTCKSNEGNYLVAP